MFLRHLMSKCFSHKLAKYILKYISWFKIGLTTMDPIFPCKSLSKIFSRNLKYSEFFSSIISLVCNTSNRLNAHVLKKPVIKYGFVIFIPCKKFSAISLLSSGFSGCLMFGFIIWSSINCEYIFVSVKSPLHKFRSSSIPMA